VDGNGLKSIIVSFSWRVFSTVGQLHVCRVAVVGGGCCVETVVFFVVTIAYLYEFAVSRAVNIGISLAYLFRAAWKVFLL
jgi:hypothetical protein